MGTRVTVKGIGMEVFEKSIKVDGIAYTIFYNRNITAEDLETLGKLIVVAQNKLRRDMRELMLYGEVQ